MSFTKNLNVYINQRPRDNEEGEQNAKLNDETIDDYNLLEEIGHGSFGHVYRATQMSNARQEYAIKCICKRKAPNIAKILSEVSIHVRLKHKHILELANVLEDLQNVYLVMEMCHGGTLAQLINAHAHSRGELKINPCQPVLPYEWIVTILAQVCQGLRYLHRHSIVHRDLNLNNLLLMKPLNPSSHQHSIQVKIADFGLAIDLRTIDSMAKVAPCGDKQPLGSTICGTPGFISPEIWTQMSTVSYKSDIFSLGSILFACIAGFTPRGDIDLSDFYPMTANLITALLDPNPDDRPELEDIESHIFMSGRLADAHRLYPITKKTDTLQMSLDEKGNVEVVFLPSHFTISVQNNGALVMITTAEAKLKQYQFYELPEVHWKRYRVVARFVHLIAAKTPKITIHCGQWFGEHFGEDENITRCVLMENGDFEVTLHHHLDSSTHKFIFDHNLKNERLEKYQTWLENMWEQIKKIERRILKVYEDMNIDLFPVSLGNNARVLAMRANDNQVEEVCKASKTVEDNNSLCSFISNCNRIKHSINISGIGNAVFFADGVLQVNFDDGSDLQVSHDSKHISYAEDGQPRIFSSDDQLPEVVVKKIAHLPQVIQLMKQLQ